MNFLYYRIPIIAQWLQRDCVMLAPYYLQTFSYNSGNKNKF